MVWVWCPHQYVDSSVTKPSITDSSGSENPELVEWQQTNQLLLSLLLVSSLTEEAMSTVVGLSSSHDIWYTLKNTFSHRSLSHELRLKDDLQHMKKNSRSVVEFSREFKTTCDQLATMGKSVDDLGKLHWYLRGLGLDFSTTQLSLSLIPSSGHGGG